MNNKKGMEPDNKFILDEACCYQFASNEKLDMSRYYKPTIEELNADLCGR